MSEARCQHCRAPAAVLFGLAVGGTGHQQHAYSVSMNTCAEHTQLAPGWRLVRESDVEAMVHQAYRWGIGEATGGMEPDELLRMLLARVGKEETTP